MSADEKKYWKSVDELERRASYEERAETEFAETPLRELFAPGRREFLQSVGFVLAGAALTGCSRAPVETAIHSCTSRKASRRDGPTTMPPTAMGAALRAGSWPSAATAGRSNWKGIPIILCQRGRCVRLVKPRSWDCTTASGCSSPQRGRRSPLGGKWIRRSRGSWTAFVPANAQYAC